MHMCQGISVCVSYPCMRVCSCVCMYVTVVIFASSLVLLRLSCYDAMQCRFDPGFNQWSYRGSSFLGGISLGPSAPGVAVVHFKDGTLPGSPSADDHPRPTELYAALIGPSAGTGDVFFVIPGHDPTSALARPLFDSAEYHLRSAASYVPQLEVSDAAVADVAVVCPTPESMVVFSVGRNLALTIGRARASIRKAPNVITRTVRPQKRKDKGGLFLRGHVAAEVKSVRVGSVTACMSPYGLVEVFVADYSTGEIQHAEIDLKTLPMKLNFAVETSAGITFHKLELNKMPEIEVNLANGGDGDERMRPRSPHPADPSTPRGHYSPSPPNTNPSVAFGFAPIEYVVPP
mmetsp:Transcript_12670/g.20644  ORF Transcript_12670/g.20644 Transcript_12670/m.20644 type:complete len:346 (-) Transcript_12670:3928-4965(-)